ncbi:hypothetical protein BS78_02G089400 [Paspalum vaginatum]|nr:hypothetical protein BS78_02G089400 [Paspalum vaginatum]
MDTTTSLQICDASLHSCTLAVTREVTDIADWASCLSIGKLDFHPGPGHPMSIGLLSTNPYTDFVDLSSDDDDDAVVTELNVHRKDHSVHVKAEIVDLTSDKDSFEGEHLAYRQFDAAQGTCLEQELYADDGQDKAAQGTLTSKKQDLGAGDGQGDAAQCTGTLEMQVLREDDVQSAVVQCAVTLWMQDVGTNDGQGVAAQCTTILQRQELNADDRQGDAVWFTPTLQRQEHAADDEQGEADLCTATQERQQPIADDGQDAVVHCVTALQRQESTADDTQCDVAHCTAALQRQESDTVHVKGNTAQCTTTLHMQEFVEVDGQNRLRVHPKFLHSNATSHKWPFGAIAELLDNAIDEVNNGATFVKIDKMKHSPDGDYSLVIKDNGGGMSPKSLRHCLSFGFSQKCMTSSIGQYGNGFKTSTMRLGPDAIVFTCTKDNRRLTRNVALLSYTFLMRSNCNDTFVPAVDYEFDALSSNFKKIMDCGEKHFSSNLSILLRWSPFSTIFKTKVVASHSQIHRYPFVVLYVVTKEILLYCHLGTRTGSGYLAHQMLTVGQRCSSRICTIATCKCNFLWYHFSDMECHGTKIIVFNLWLNGALEMELDFTTDKEDIIISGAPEIPGGCTTLERNHVENRFRYSLRVYASILYLHVPESFQIILCGRAVEPHYVVNDLIYPECIKYRPQVEVTKDADVITTLGYLKGAPRLDIYGFNVYHKNRLILPYWRAGSCNQQRRGIAGVLEANFIRPTHDKQDFERTGLFYRLETRLKDMANERYHCHLVGYTPKRPPPAQCVSTTGENDDNSFTSEATTETCSLHHCFNGYGTRDPLHANASALMDQMDCGACPSVSVNVRRKFCPLNFWRAQKRRNTNVYSDQPESDNDNETAEFRWILDQNAVLKAECSELEAAGKELTSKVYKLRKELNVWRQMYQHMRSSLEGLRPSPLQGITSDYNIGFL